MIKLVVFDMDGVIFEHLNFWLELHKVYGTYEEGFELTKKYLKTDYQKLVDEVIGRLWKDKPAKPYFDLINSVNYVLGAKETLKELKQRNYKLGIVSSGPSDLAERARRDCYIDYSFTNKLLIEHGKVVGTTNINYWPIRFGSKKDPLLEICRMCNTNLKNTIVVAHEENDIEMAKEASLAIAFHPLTTELDKYCSIIIKKGKPDLRQILKHIP